MNPKIAAVWKVFADLPPEAQQQVVDYITFLKQRYALPPLHKPARRTKLASDAFIGMWRSRKDLRDSTAWVRRARDSEWLGRRE